MSALATACPSSACSGWSCFSKRPEASVRSPSRVDVRWTFGPFEVAASISTRVVVCAHLGAGAAHDAGDRGRALGVLDHADVGVEPALHVVQRRHRLARAGAAHGEPAAGHQVGVEGVHGLPGQEHHVVRDVDDVADRALAGRHQARLEPRRRGPEPHVLEQPGGEAGAQVGGVDLDGEAGHRVALRMRIVRPGRRGERRLGGRVDLAGDAVDAEAVGPVRRDLELEDVRGDRQDVRQRRAGGRACRRAP